MALNVSERSGSGYRLIDETITAIAHQGLHGLSLRQIAASAGVSTASIFHFFGKKSRLIEAAIERALELEEDFHARLLSDLEGLEPDATALADLVVSYVFTRSGLDLTQFWLEIVFNGDWLDAGAAVTRWNKLRHDCWAQIIGIPDRAAEFSDFLVPMLLMEETYASALRGDVAYWPLLSETVRVVAARIFGLPACAEGAVLRRLMQGRAPQFTIADAGWSDTIANRLLMSASDKIFAEGVHTLSDRDIASLAGTSSSMIAYHFGDSTSFLRHAIWRTMLHDVPKLLDPAISAETMRDDLDDWVSVMEGMVGSAAERGKPGFYLGYTRITGQAALLCRRQPELIPLIRHLRIIEGTGTYRSSRMYWPQSIRFDETHAAAFGIWIKGVAILDSVHDADAQGRSKLLRRAASFFASA